MCEEDGEGMEREEGRWEAEQEEGLPGGPAVAGVLRVGGYLCSSGCREGSPGGRRDEF